MWALVYPPGISLTNGQLSELFSWPFIVRYAWPLCIGVCRGGWRRISLNREGWCGLLPRLSFPIYHRQTRTWTSCSSIVDFTCARTARKFIVLPWNYLDFHRSPCPAKKSLAAGVSELSKVWSSTRTCAWSSLKSWRDKNGIMLKKECSYLPELQSCYCLPMN